GVPIRTISPAFPAPPRTPYCASISDEFPSCRLKSLSLNALVDNVRRRTESTCFSFATPQSTLDHARIEYAILGCTMSLSWAREHAALPSVRPQTTNDSLSFAWLLCCLQLDFLARKL